MNEGAARRNLADLGINAEQNLRRGIDLYHQAQRLFPPDNQSYVRALLNEGTTRQSLAEQGIERRANLLRAIKSHQQAMALLPVGSISAAYCQLSVSNAHTLLAREGVNVSNNLSAAIGASRAARKAFRRGSPDALATQVNEGLAWQISAERNSNRAAYQNACRLYRAAAAGLERIGSQHQVLLAYRNLAVVNKVFGDWEGAQQAFTAAIAQAEILRFDTQTHRRADIQTEQQALYQTAIMVSLRNAVC